MKRNFGKFISNMSGYSAKHDKLLKLAELSLEEISALVKTGDGDELVTCVERVSALVKRLGSDAGRRRITELEEIVNWSELQTPKLKHF